MANARLTTKISPSAAAAKLAFAEVQAAPGSPSSVLSIPTVVRYGPVPTSAGAVIRQIGSTRRVFLLNPFLTGEEIDGLAFRIRILSKNKSINSILLSNAPFECNSKLSQNLVFPTSALEQDERYIGGEGGGTFLGLGEARRVCGGYDARALYSCDVDEKRLTLEAMMKLALATWGGQSTADRSEPNVYNSKIPLVTVPHGLLSDGGYAVAMGSYVLATEYSSFAIRNPLRGLALDPIGLSYILPRLGWEYNQPSANYPVGSILALTGYDADANDMVETGLATHYFDSYAKVGALERSLAELPSWEHQRLVKQPPRTYTGQSIEDAFSEPFDANAKYRNVSVANLMNAMCSFDAAGQELSEAPREDEREFWEFEDPSLVLKDERGRAFGDRESTLLNVAATFQDIFERERSVAGIMERLQEVSVKESADEEEVEVTALAKALLENMNAQSPLALMVVHRLMKLGERSTETLESCMKRELNVQIKLMGYRDFERWAKSGSKEGEFRSWSYDKVTDVTDDEVEELIGN